MAQHEALIASLDQGTTSTRCIVFDHAGTEVARHQLEHRQLLPRAGWVEHDPVEIWQVTCATIETALQAGGLAGKNLTAIGVTNQRETVVVWNRRTGRPYHNAIVWQDTRTDRAVARLERAGHGETIRDRTGLPPATYFSASKLQWLLDNVEGLRVDAERGEALCGTIDSWLLWNLTGGVEGGLHVTDVTNASRTMLMDLRTLGWDADLLDLFTVPLPMLPAIMPSSSVTAFATTHPAGPFGAAVPITAVLGDQQAAMVGQLCFEPGSAKNTYGTGSFLLQNTGEQIVHSKHGLLTTVCYQFDGRPAHYALEGSIAVTGSAVQWLRDQLGVISTAAESEALARQVDDSAGMYFVPAFSGLFAPYWRPDARGAIVGLSRFHTSAHLARAALEAICYQTRDVVEAMRDDTGITLELLRVDGGVTANHLCMQLQSDVLGIPVSKPAVAETTALGAAYAAGLAAGCWHEPAELHRNWREAERWSPQWPAGRRAEAYAGWKRAVDRSLGWVDVP